MSGPNHYTVIGLVDQDTGELKIAGVIPGLVDTDDGFENSGSTRWIGHVPAGDPCKAESLAHELHVFGGIPAEHTVADLPLGSVIVHDIGNGSRIRALALDGEFVQVWFVGDEMRTPARYRATDQVRAVLPAR